MAAVGWLAWQMKKVVCTEELLEPENTGTLETEHMEKKLWLVQESKMQEQKK